MKFQTPVKEDHLVNSPYREHIKNEDKEGYPLSDFEEPPVPTMGPLIPENCQIPRVKAEPQLSDSDQGHESEEETYPHKSPNPNVDSSQQVSDVLSKLVEHQAAMQDKNLKVMEKLVSCSTNAFVPDDIPVFDGLKGSIDFENWLLELDKAVEIMGMSISELAFSKSSGTPHKVIKCLR